MKKFLVTLSVLFMLSSSVYASATLTWAAVAGAIKLGVEIYKAIPGASYTVEVCTKGKSCSYKHADDCDTALQMARSAFDYENTDKVVILSEHSTVNGSCRNKTYKSRSEIKD